ncbi:MAG: type I restriction endonuclease subunit R [Deltaproteobacteria bacterium]|nr:type I restriction endonuclease subunit R [Deltaproteobacteria bacterium]
MTTPNEETLVELPLIRTLRKVYGYHYIPPSQHAALRGGEREVIFLPLLVAALARLNRLTEAQALPIAQELVAVHDNRRWLEILRGQLSKRLPGEESHRTITVVDLDHPERNHYAVTHQLSIVGRNTRRPDVVIYVNGLPLVVIEAKSPLRSEQEVYHAIEQLLQYERDVPRLFYPNQFNIVTNDLTLLVGATGAGRFGFARWRDPWPKRREDFNDDTERGLFSLLEPRRLMDLIAHFVVFETRDGHTVKKMARYQQLRAVNKMVERTVGPDPRRGLVWHTQGSGKSLTMAFAALKLKSHRGVVSPRLENPNLLIITDRLDLHDQISATFMACGLPNPTRAESISELRTILQSGGVGQTVLTTIFRFRWDVPGLSGPNHSARLAALKEMAAPRSDRWILMVDEAHRTQEKDLGAYLRAILPEAVRFGFTGTPVKSNDLDTYQNFSPPGERYLDKYGLIDAVQDGATVPIYHQTRLTEWKLNAKLLDVAFDQTFVHEGEELREELRRRGVTKGDLARFPERIALIAHDIWTHYTEHVMPDGHKGQVVAIDRLACVAYKEALDATITRWLVKRRGMGEAEAQAQAALMTACVYSPAQHDDVAHPELTRHQITPEDVTTKIVPRFNNPEDPLCLLIVCNKLLTGFDAPIERVMYLDNPLREHNLLQAIARTNRRYDRKEHGLIVDYIGVTQRLAEALAAYHAEDVAGATRDVDLLHDQLFAAHRDVMAFVAGAVRTDDPKESAAALVRFIATEDRWYTFRQLADAFILAYGALTPDPKVLPYLVDLKYIGAALPYGLTTFEQKESTDWQRYSEKVRRLLNEHLEVTGLGLITRLHAITDPEFWDDFTPTADVEAALVRKLTELKKETTDRVERNPTRYTRFSKRVLALIDQFKKGLLTSTEPLEALARELVEADGAATADGLDEGTYAVAELLHAAAPHPEGLMGWAALAKEITDLYGSEEHAPLAWQDRPEIRKTLRQRVRRMLMAGGVTGWETGLAEQVDELAVKLFARDEHRGPR